MAKGSIDQIDSKSGSIGRIERNIGMSIIGPGPYATFLAQCVEINVIYVLVLTSNVASRMVEDGCAVSLGYIDSQRKWRRHHRASRIKHLEVQELDDGISLGANEHLETNKRCPLTIFSTAQPHSSARSCDSRDVTGWRIIS